MKRASAAAAAAFLTNLLASLIVAPYRNMLIDLGRAVTGGNDIADLPRHVGVGLLITSVGAIVIGLLIERMTRAAQT